MNTYKQALNNIGETFSKRVDQLIRKEMPKWDDLNKQLATVTQKKVQLSSRLSNADNKKVNVNEQLIAAENKIRRLAL